MRRYDEPELFNLSPPRSQKPEDLVFYSAVVFLRTRSMKVWRISGRQAQVQGRIVSNRMLKWLASNSGWNGQIMPELQS